MLGSLAPVNAIEPKEFASVLTLNVSAPVALIGTFDAMLRKAQGARVIGVTSSVGKTPRAYWGAYGASKAAFETLIGAYGDETAQITKIRTAIVDPGATRTAMRARAYPGEDPQTVKPPERVAERIATLAVEGVRGGVSRASGLTRQRLISVTCATSIPPPRKPAFAIHQVNSAIAP